MRYFGIPKLGSYLSVGFTYESSLHPDAFVPKKVEKVEEEEEEEEEVKSKKGKKGKDKKGKDKKGKGKKAKDESSDDDDEDDEEKKVEEPPPEPVTIPVDMVICFDTVGDDKEIPIDCCKTIHLWAKEFKRIYELEEREQFIQEYTENIKAELSKADEDLEELTSAKKEAAKQIKNEMKSLKREKKISNEERAMREAKIKMDAAFSILSTFKSKISEIGRYRIPPKAKSLKVLLACLYLLGYSKYFFINIL